MKNSKIKSITSFIINFFYFLPYQKRSKETVAYQKILIENKGLKNDSLNVTADLKKSITLHKKTKESKA